VSYCSFGQADTAECRLVGRLAHSWDSADLCFKGPIDQLSNQGWILRCNLADQVVSFVYRPDGTLEQLKAIQLGKAMSGTRYVNFDIQFARPSSIGSASSGSTMAPYS